MAEDEGLIDDYELINCIATGNSTQVWQVRQVSSGQQFAMKLLLEEAFADAEQKKSLRHEANIGMALDHPNIIKIHDLKVTRKTGYFIMEYFPAPNLKSLLRSGAIVAQGRAKKIMECLAQALDHLHQKGWVHKDVKPENVLVNKGGEVRLIDFSLASRQTSTVSKLLTSKKRIVIQGTRTYLAPELIRREPLTFAADMYSLGILLFEILAGRPPFVHGNPNELLMMHVRDAVPEPSFFNKNVTPELDKLVIRMLSKKPKERPGNMQELFAEVRSMKFFHEEPEALAKAKAEREKADAYVSLDARLDSRADAERQSLPGAEKPKPAPPKPAPPKPAAAKPAPEKPAAGKPAAPAAQSPPPQPPQQAPPGMPMPGYPMPGMPMPGQPMPGMPFPGYPGMPMGGYPGQPFPGQPMPGMPMPGMPMPGMPGPGAPPPGAPPAGQPQSPQPPAAQGGAQPQPPKKQPPPPAPDDDLPMASLDDLDIE